MLRSTKYPRLGNKLGLSYKSVNPVVISTAPVTPTWYGTNTKGFSIGGGGGGVSAVADKATFSTETTAAQTSANFPAVRYKISGGGIDTHAYYIGGADNSDTSQTTGYKLTHNNDTLSSVSSVDLPSARADIYMAVYTTAGYSYGGSTTANSNNQTAAYKTPFSTDTTAAQTSANLSVGRASGHTLSSDTAAMYLGGFNSSFTRQTTVDKMPFSTETTAGNASLALPTARGYGNFGSMNSTLNSKGYMAPCTSVTTYAKATYSTDTTSNLSDTNGKLQSSGMSSTTICYTLGGEGPVATAYKFTVSTETGATISGMNKSIAKALSSGCC